MRKTLLKNTVRTIRKNLVSWLAISVVVMMSCGIYFGTFFYAQSMAETLASYGDETRFEDFNILAVTGLKADEIEQLRQMEGILDAEGTWRVPDSSLLFRGTETEVVVNALTTRLSLAELLEGTLPQKDGECALTQHIMNERGIQLGDTVQLSYGGDLPDGLMKSDTFVVTARVNHPDSLSTGFDDQVFLSMDAFDLEEVHDNYNCVRVDADLPADEHTSFDSYSDSVGAVRDRVREYLEPIGASHDVRTREEAEQELSDARDEADEKLSDAREDIKEAEDKIEKAQKKINRADKKVLKAEKKLADADKELSDADRKVADAEKKIAKAERTIAKNQKKLKKARRKFSSGRRKLKKAERTLRREKRKLDKAKKQLKSEKKKLKKGKKQIDKAEKDLKKSKAALEKLEKAGAAPAGARSQIKRAEKDLKAKKKEYNAAKKVLDRSEHQLSKAEKLYRSQKKKLDKGKATLRSQKKKLNRAERKLSRGKREVKDKKRELKDKKQELEDKKQELEDKKAELAEKKTELADARQELADGKQKYKDKKEETDEKIADAQKEIDELKHSAYVFLTRNEMEGYVLMKETARKMKQLGSVFVIIFSAVGAIVVLSTIVILIDADKKLIGTMKAFGFRNWEIIVGYLIFAVTASIFGMLLSIGLSAILQGIIAIHKNPLFYINPVGMASYWKTYFMLFAVQVVVSAAVAVAGTIVNATAYSALSLMDGSAGKKAVRKKAKAGGKGSLYTRLILRNMRTDLVRVLTSIIIIAGSCLLMGMGVTLRDSFHTMMPLSAAEVNHYDLEVTVMERAQEGEYNRVRDYLSAQGVDYAQIRKSATVYRAGDTEEFLNVISADEGVYPDYIELVDEAGKNAYRLDESDVLLCNRIAENTGLRAGGEMLLYDEDYQPHSLTVDGVCRNYLGRTLYLSKKAYEGVFGQAPEYNTFLVRVEREQRDALREKLESQFNALSLSYTDDLPDTLVGLKSNYDIIVVVVTALAILMSVFVLLNLVNIFVSRRQNEVIIMAVNGFSWPEQRDYLLRETIVITAAGLLLGALGGTLLTNPLVRIVESAETMFDRGFNPRAWVFAWVLEILFAVIINWLAYRRVRHLKLTDLTK